MPVGRLVCAVCRKDMAEFSVEDGYRHADGTPTCVVDGLVVCDTVADPDDPVCDFCSGPKPNWTLLTEPITVGVLYTREVDGPVNSLTHRESPEWACCGDCKRLIEKDRWEAMAEKCLRNMERMHGAMRPDVRAEVLAEVIELHASVKAGWIGSIVPAAHVSEAG